MSGPPGPLSGLSVAAVPVPGSARYAAERYIVTGEEDFTPAMAEVFADGRYRVCDSARGCDERGDVVSDEDYMQITVALDSYRARHGHDGTWRRLWHSEVQLARGDTEGKRSSTPTRTFLTRRYGEEVRWRNGEREVAVRDRDTAGAATGSIPAARARNAAAEAVPGPRSTEASGHRPGGARIKGRRGTGTTQLKPGSARR